MSTNQSDPYGVSKHSELDRQSPAAKCHAAVSRRGFLGDAVTSFGGIALASMLSHESRAQSQEAGAVKVLHHAPRAKRVVQLFMAGAASHIDLWDHKPLLK